MQVTPDVLVPRPETETVVEAALDFVVRGGLRMEKLRILDIGTGSGALLLALLHELPNAIGTGTDISIAALDVARANAAAMRPRNPLQFRCLRYCVRRAGPIRYCRFQPTLHRARGDSVARAGGAELRSRSCTRRWRRRACRLQRHCIRSPAPFGTGRTTICRIGRGPGNCGSRVVYQCGINRRRRAQGFGRDSACTWCRSSAMNWSHSHPMKIAELDYRRKNRLDYGPETTSFQSRNRPVTVASPKTPEPMLCVVRRKADDEKPASKRRQTKSPDTGLDASPVGRIIFRNLGRCA